MKIISKFHDYYDTASAHGVSDVYFQRAESQQPYGGRLADILRRMRYWNSTQYFSPCLVLFCGKVYPMVKIKPGNPYVFPAPEPFYLTCLEDWGRYEAKQRDERAADKWAIWNDWPRPRYRNPEYFDVSKQAWSEILEAAKVIDCTEELRALNAPIAFLECSYDGGKFRLTINARLSPFGFQKVKGPFEAYQEIDSFLSGVIGTNNNPPDNITDIQKIHNHGFDKVTSFRKMKR